MKVKCVHWHLDWDGADTHIWPNNSCLFGSTSLMLGPWPYILTLWHGLLIYLEFQTMYRRSSGKLEAMFQKQQEHADDENRRSIDVGVLTPKLTGVLRCWQDEMLRSKGLKDAMCVGWFGNDWDCSVGCPPEAMITWVVRYWLATQYNK